MGGCYSAEMRRPAIRSTAHDPMDGAMGLIHGSVPNDQVLYGC